MLNYFPNIVQVVPKDDYVVMVYFDDGKIVSYDVKDKLNSPVFKKIKDIEVFKNTCTILNDTLAWDISGNRDAGSCVDIDPDTLYELPAVNEMTA